MSIQARGLPYELLTSTVTHGCMVPHGYVIRRLDDDYPRTVAFVDSIAQWEIFVAALRAGTDEVAAVRAIDEAER